MGEKDFQRWHANKKRIHNEGSRIFFNEREIWSCFLGENIGFEQDGRGEEFLRPIVVLKKFNHESFWSLPLTKSIKRLHPYHFVFSFQPEVLSSAILSQIRLLDAKRLKYKVGNISQRDFELLKTKIRRLLV